MITPDIFITIKFYKKEDGGRNIPTPSNFFSCVFVIGDKNYDARMLLEGIGSIYPGDKKINVPVKFLCSDLVIPKINVGDKFYVRDGRVIADGIIEKIINAKS